MRRSIIAFAMLGLAHEANAADYLRGSHYDYDVAPYADWSGAYAGLHGGYSGGRADFGSSGLNFVEGTLAVPTLGDYSMSALFPSRYNLKGSSFGGFIGYNWQSEDALFGIELGYSRMSVSRSASLTLEEIVTDSGYEYDVTSTARLSTKITDLVTLRARGGVVFGNFMPYGTLGLALGRVDFLRTVRVSHPDATDIGGGDPVPLAFSGTDDSSRKGRYAYGFSAGLGFDWEIQPGWFLRGEYEYVGFDEVDDVELSFHTARAGIGVRF